MFIGSENSEFLFLNDFFANNYDDISSHFDKVMFQLKRMISYGGVFCRLNQKIAQSRNNAISLENNVSFGVNYLFELNKMFSELKKLGQSNTESVALCFFKVDRYNEEQNNNFYMFLKQLIACKKGLDVKISLAINSKFDKMLFPIFSSAKADTPASLLVGLEQLDYVSYNNCDDSLKKIAFACFSETYKFQQKPRRLYIFLTCGQEENEHLNILFIENYKDILSRFDKFMFGGSLWEESGFYKIIKDTCAGELVMLSDTVPYGELSFGGGYSYGMKIDDMFSKMRCSECVFPGIIEKNNENSTLVVFNLDDSYEVSKQKNIESFFSELARSEGSNKNRENIEMHLFINYDVNKGSPYDVLNEGNVLCKIIGENQRSDKKIELKDYSGCDFLKSLVSSHFPEVNKWKNIPTVNLGNYPRYSFNDLEEIEVYNERYSIFGITPQQQQLIKNIRDNREKEAYLKKQKQGEELELQEARKKLAEANSVWVTKAKEIEDNFSEDKGKGVYNRSYYEQIEQQNQFCGKWGPNFSFVEGGNIGMQQSKRTLGSTKGNIKDMFFKSSFDEQLELLEKSQGKKGPFAWEGGSNFSFGDNNSQD